MDQKTPLPPYQPELRIYKLILDAAREQFYTPPTPEELAQNTEPPNIHGLISVLVEQHTSTAVRLLTLAEEIMKDHLPIPFTDRDRADSWMEFHRSYIALCLIEYILETDPILKMEQHRRDRLF